MTTKLISNITIIVFISFLCMEVKAASKKQIISEPLDTQKRCGTSSNSILYIDDTKDVIITGKSSFNSHTDCKIVLGLQAGPQAAGARLVVHFESLYIHDCGVKLQVNESDDPFESKNYSNRNFNHLSYHDNHEIYSSECNTKGPSVVYSRPKYFIIVRLMKENNHQKDYNFRLNVTMAESVPSSGLEVHVVIIVSFVVVIVVLCGLYLLVKYLGRLSDSWREQQSDVAMARAINIYNSSSAETHVSHTNEEADLVYMEPGSRDRGRNGGAEIAFVHPDGRLERFRTAGQGRQRQPSRCQSHLQKMTPGDEGHSPGTSELSPRDVVVLPATQPKTKLLEKKKKKKTADSDLGFDVPPSYEEALAMPGPAVSDEGDSLGDSDSDTAPLQGRLTLDYVNVRPGGHSDPSGETLVPVEVAIEDQSDHVLISLPPPPYPESQSLNS